LAQENDSGAYSIEFKNSGFAQFTAERGQPRSGQAIRFFGFGSVKETLRGLTGQTFRTGSLQRDESRSVCRQRAVSR